MPDSPCESAARRVDLIADFIEALAKRGLPEDASLADLIQHERGSMGMTVASSLLTDLYVAANAREAQGDEDGAAALRDFAKNGVRGATDE